jgi:hypothetical protein
LKFQLFSIRDHNQIPVQSKPSVSQKPVDAEPSRKENQGNPERNHKLWNTVSTERYILHIQVLLVGMMLQINGKFTMGKLACDVHIQ